MTSECAGVFSLSLEKLGRPLTLQGCMPHVGLLSFVQSVLPLPSFYSCLRCSHRAGMSVLHSWLCCQCVMLAALSLMLSLLVSHSDFCSSLFFFLPPPPFPSQGCPLLHRLLPAVCKPEQAGPERPQYQGSVLRVLPLRMCGWQYGCGGCQPL